jgi:hypothetical protein
VTYPNIAPAGGAYPLTTSWGVSGVFANTDFDNTNGVGNYAWGAADSAPVVARVATTGAETYTIVSGSVTTINGTTIDGVSVAVNDPLVIKDAPPATGPGAQDSMQPGNGIYYVVSVASNITVARSATMSPASSKPGPAHRVAFVGNGGSENGGSLFEVTTPSGGGTFIYGTTAIQWTRYPLPGGAPGGGPSIDGGSANTVYGDSSTIDGGTA